jgi:hypothetical protein
MKSCSFSTPLFLPLSPIFLPHYSILLRPLCSRSLVPRFLPGRAEEDNAKARLKRPIHSQLNWPILLWCYTWRKNWVNCAVLTGTSSDLRTVFSSRFSHRVLRSLDRESHSFLSLPADTTMASYQCTQQNWQTWWEICLCQRTFSSVFRAVSFTQCRLNSWQSNIACIYWIYSVQINDHVVTYFGL